MGKFSKGAADFVLSLLLIAQDWLCLQQYSCYMSELCFCFYNESSNPAFFSLLGFLPLVKENLCLLVADLRNILQGPPRGLTSKWQNSPKICSQSYKNFSREPTKWDHKFLFVVSKPNILWHCQVVGEPSQLVALSSGPEASIPGQQREVASSSSSSPLS